MFPSLKKPSPKKPSPLKPSLRKTLSLVTILTVMLGTLLLPLSAYSQCELLATFNINSVEFPLSAGPAGDVNNDGYADIIVSDRMNDAGGIDAGQVVIYSGKTSEVLYTFTGESAGDEFGSTVSGLVDVNNDGYGDIIIGASKSDAGGIDAGRAYVFSGQTGENLYTITGDSPNTRLGQRVSDAGDIDNDGFDDFIVYKNFGFVSDTLISAGWARVFSGQTGEVLHSLSSSYNHNLSSVGDVDNDGFDDLIVGYPTFHYFLPELFQSGHVVVYSGLTGDTLQYYVGEENHNQLGYSASGVGDINEDGYDDIIYGEPGWDGGAGTNTGRALVRSGATGEVLYSFTGENSIDNFGRDASSVGDVNNDGFVDLMIFSIEIYDRPTRAYLYSGKTGGHLYTISGDLGNFMNSGASGIGDFNNDGYDDFLIKSFDAENNSMDISVYTRCNCCDVSGDANNDGSFNIADVTASIATIFSGGSTSDCQDEADSNGVNSFNIADVTSSISRIFTNGPAPICGSAGE